MSRHRRPVSDDEKAWLDGLSADDRASIPYDGEMSAAERRAIDEWVIENEVFAADVDDDSHGVTDCGDDDGEDFEAGHDDGAYKGALVGRSAATRMADERATRSHENERDRWKMRTGRRRARMPAGLGEIELALIGVDPRIVPVGETIVGDVSSSLPAMLTPAAIVAGQHLVNDLTRSLRNGHGDSSAILAAYRARFAHHVDDAWLEVTLHHLRIANAARVELARHPRRRRMRSEDYDVRGWHLRARADAPPYWRTADVPPQPLIVPGSRVLSAIRSHLEHEFPTIALPAHIDERAISWAIAHFGGGGRGRLSAKAMRAVLRDPEKLGSKLRDWKL